MKNYVKFEHAVKIEMPKLDEKIYFRNYRNSLEVPFVFYADFECVLQILILVGQIQRNHI